MLLFMKHAETLEQFLQRAGDTLFPAGKPKVVSVNSKNYDGDTPLHIAALIGDRQAARLVLQAGANVNAKGDMSASPLHYAVMSGHAQVAELLLRHGADPDAQNELGSTPRSMAQQKGLKGMTAVFRGFKD